ncbi:P-loop containing nucleoside triphosphate hydrolase protein [Lentinula raphanica]|nr:P-loop containing nucleoside triphosphate hydrolase protein [Lentinula raphanica]
MPDSSVESASQSENPEILATVRTLIRHRFPHDLHDYVLQGICQAALEGLHVISVVKTGGGKTTYFSGFMVLLQELSKLPISHPLKKSIRRHIPENPLCIIVYPTKGLEEEMESTFNSLGIPSLAINEDTLKAARVRHEDLYALAVRPELRCLLLSPEQLSSKPFNTILANPIFYSRIVALGIDEIHLILAWGKPGFRISFRDIGNVLMRLPRWTTLTGVTATLPAGTDTIKLMEVLGLRPGSFAFTRRSNHRLELQFIFRILRHSLQGWDFPDLDWLLKSTRKTIIYCRTISLAFRLYVYLWRNDTPSDSPTRRKRFRIYCSLYSDNYNKRSRTTFVEDPNCQFLISTDALKVGNDFPNVEDAVVVDPLDPADVLQKGGRADRAEAALKRGKGDDHSREAGSGNLDADIEGKMTIYRDGSAYTCKIGCKPEPPLPPLSRKAPSGHRAGSGMPTSKKLSNKMREYGQQSLQQFRRRIWNSFTSPRIEELPPFALLPDDKIKGILDEFAKLKMLDDVTVYVNGFLRGHEEDLWNEIKTLERKFKRILIELEPDVDVSSNGDLFNIKLSRLARALQNQTLPARNTAHQPPPGNYADFFSSLPGTQSSTRMPLQTR